LLRILGVLSLLALVLLAGGLAAAWTPDRPVEALKPRWAGPPSRFIDVGGLQVHLRDEGPRDDPAPIVLIHGTAASLHTWEGWAAALRGERRVVRFDLPGFGLTGPNPSGDYRAAANTRFVLDLLDALKIDRCVLAGSSLGGEIAWRTALAAPRRVERLVLVDAGGYVLTTPWVRHGYRLARMLVVRGLARNVLPRPLVALAVRDVYGDASRVSEALIDRYYELMLREGNRKALAQRFEQLQPGIDSAQIATLKVPTLVLWGGRDRLYPPDIARAFAHDVSGSRLVVFDELGHVPHEEDPARSVAELRRFLGMGPAQ
jgi:pimeloyl-ACP methyl ester carboxylesterase